MANKIHEEQGVLYVENTTLAWLGQRYPEFPPESWEILNGDACFQPKIAEVVLCQQAWPITKLKRWWDLGMQVGLFWEFSAQEIKRALAEYPRIVFYLEHMNPEPQHRADFLTTLADFARGPVQSDFQSSAIRRYAAGAAWGGMDFYLEFLKGEDITPKALICIKIQHIVDVFGVPTDDPRLPELQQLVLGLAKAQWDEKTYLYFWVGVETAFRIGLEDPVLLTFIPKCPKFIRRRLLEKVPATHALYSQIQTV